MARRCGCASDQCSCRIIGGDGVVVSGTGSRSNPVVIGLEDVSGGGGGGSVERLTGEIIMYGGPTAPAGWLLCNGAAVSRAVYAALFDVVGVANGAGDGSTTFNLPNMQARVPLGVDGSHPRGTSGGSSTVALATANLPAHAHVMDHDHSDTSTSSGGLHDHALGRSLSDGGSPSTVREGEGTSKTLDRQMVESDGTHSHTVNIPPHTGSTGSVGAGTPVNITPPYVAQNFLIKT